MLTYPTNQFEPGPVIIDFSEQATRERLSKGALKGFFNIIDHWKIRDEEAMKLLGGIANGTYYKYKRNPAEVVLDQDKLTRISYLAGIFKALNILHSKELADKWIKLPNKNRIFNNQSPLHYMIKGGMPAIQTVRRLLDGRRGGR